MTQSSSGSGPKPAQEPMPDAVVSSKLAPPRSSSRLVERTGLLTQMLEARRHSCLAVVGPAGVGKTTLLASWRQALLPLGFDVAWLSLSTEDKELPRLLEGLVASLAQVAPAITREASLLSAGAADPDGVERLVIGLVRGIASHPRELVLVLDDLQHLTQADGHAALQWLLDYAPPNLHLALVSRSPVPLALERLRAQGQVLELALRELRFSLAETEQFLKLQLGEIDARSVRLLHELTDGWVAGLQLFAIEWRKKQPAGERRRSDEAFTRVPMRDPRAFSNFFEREVLSQLSPGEVELLTCLAPCRRICASLCATLMGKPAAVAEAVALLARLEADNLFIAPIDGSGPDTWYRLHPLLREVLRARFDAADAALRLQAHARAWVWFRERGHLDEAIRHAIPAGEADHAAEMVEQCVPGLFAQGERGSVVSLLRQLPPAQVQARLGLRLWMMRAQFYVREFAACERSIAQLLQDIPEDDAPSRFLLAVHQAVLAVARDDTDAALTLLPMVVPPGADVLAIGGRNNALSWLHMHRGEYAKARQVQLDAQPLMIAGAPLIGTSAGSLYGRCLMGLSYAMEGQMLKAERIYRAVQQEAEPMGKAGADASYLAAALLGDVLYELNDTQAARALLEEKLEVLERVAIPDSVLRVLRVLATAHWLAGNRMEAFAYLERLEDYAVKYSLDRLLAYSLAYQFQLHLAQREFLAAEADCARLNELSARHLAPGNSALAEIGELAQHVQIRWCMAQHDYETAAAKLAPLLAQVQARGRQRMVARLLLEGALIEVRRGHAEAARELTLSALRLGHKLGLLRSLLDINPAAIKLIREIARSEVLDPVLAFYVERLEATQQSMVAAAAPKPAGDAKRRAASELESFSEREIDVLNLLSQAMPNKKIARALGLSPETVKWYLSRIYGKLRVAGRDEAVAKVRDLGLDATTSAGLG